MLYLTCTTINSVDLAHYGVSRAKDWVSVDCGTNTEGNFYRKICSCVIGMDPSFVSTLSAIQVRLVHAFIIAKYGVMNNLLFMPDLVALYAKLKELQKINFNLHFKFLAVYI